VEDHESLETGAVVSEFSDSVQTEIDDFFTDGVMSSGEVVGGVFLSRDELFWMEELSVGAGSDLIDDGGFKIEENCSWNVFSGSGFREKGVECIITSSDGLVGWHLTIWLDPVLEAEEFPTGITDLDAALSDVD
jgi:hypothetical protein